MQKMAQSEIEQALRGAPGWERQGDSITRTFTLASFPEAMLFAAAVGNLAQRADHHPDILIQYKRVKLTLSTHTAGGLTAKDFALAGEVNGVAPAGRPGAEAPG
jgi:4a-hydroxytetrahydrobiopterin dehydratase